MPRSSKSKVSDRGRTASAKGQARASSVGKRAASRVTGTAQKVSVGMRRSAAAGRGPTGRSARVRKASRRYGGSR